MRWFTRMARKAANRATNVNAVLLACERSQILFSLDQQQRKHHPTSPMPKKGKQVSANDDSEVYEVEDILDDRVNPKTGEKMYLIKWLGYSEAENTWENKSNLNCPLVLKNYHARINYNKKKKRLQDSKNKLHQHKQSVKHKKKKVLSRKVISGLLHKQTIHKSHNRGTLKKSKVQLKNRVKNSLPLQVTIPLSSLPKPSVASNENTNTAQDSLTLCENATSSSPFPHINCEFGVDSSSCDESFLQDEGYTFPTTVKNPVLENILFPWVTTSADIPVSVNFCDYKDFYTDDPGGTLIQHYPTTPSVVSIEGVDSSSVSVGSPAPPPVDGNFNLTLSPSLSISSVNSLTTTSDIEVVDDITDSVTPIKNDNDLQSTKNHLSSNPTPPHINPPHVGKERHHSSSPRFRMTMQRVRRHTPVDYSTLTEASVNGLNCSLNKSSQLEQPYALRARDYQQELREWSTSLNAKCKGKEAQIFVENKYDEFPIPKDFEYVCTNMYGRGVPNPADHDPVTYCKCQKCGIGNNGCCPAQLEALFPYYANGRVRISPGKPIYECNSACVCGPECCNRVVQKLRSIPLCIFRTGDAKGWGVKAVTEIKKNEFVCEYTGEVIMFDEAERRGAVANAKGLTYIFDLDFHSEDDECCFSIDASKYGNISHFFNHSCDPNLMVYSVWVDFIDPQLPRIAFFAKRNIHEGEELTFDYQISYNVSHCQQFSRVKCLCGSKNCQKYLM